MSAYSVFRQPPPGWAERCSRGNLLFHSPDWQQLLERGFGCESLYLWSDALGNGAAITVFRAGPFRVGYLGFPFGSAVGADVLDFDQLRKLRSVSGVKLPVAVKIPVSPFNVAVELDLEFEAVPETAITDLRDWEVSRISKNRRRDLNRARRSNLEVVDASAPDDGSRLFELYIETLRRHGGAARYTEEYFRSLVELAGRRDDLRVLLAKREGIIGAFVVVARHGPTACYLHGATDWSMRDYRPSAVLFHEAIEWAKSRGCGCFNFMSSPKDQVSLTQYKEKWGAETREHRTYTLPTGRLFACFRSAERLYRLVRR